MLPILPSSYCKLSDKQVSVQEVSHMRRIKHQLFDTAQLQGAHTNIVQTLQIIVLERNLQLSVADGMYWA